MPTAQFACNMVEPYGFDELRQWVARERDAGRIPHEAVSIAVIHRDREAEGSCRWCGCRENETVMFDPS